MKLVLAIVHDDDANDIIRILNQKGLMVTKMASTGGFLRVGNTTLIIGVEDDKVDDRSSLNSSVQPGDQLPIFFFRYTLCAQDYSNLS